MKRCRRLGTALAGALMIATGLHAQEFSLRTGTWSMTMTIQGDSGMAELPPDVRAELEAQLRKPNTTTTCVTQAQLKDLNLGKTDDRGDEDCEIVSKRITPTVADITRRCSGDDAGTETSHFEAPTPVTFKGTVTRKGAAGTSIMNMTGKWASARCTE
jgi:hypothetical protein